MKRSDNEFWNSTLAKIVQMIEMYADEANMKAAAMKNESYQSKYFRKKEDIQFIQSMKEIPGW